MLLKIHPENPQRRKIDHAIELLKEGGIMIYPTDSVYAIGCDFVKQDAVDRICKLKGLKPEKANLTFMCSDISQVAEYTSQISDDIFITMKRNTPGPFTFIINSNNQVPKLFKNKKKQVGVRIPENKIVQQLINELGNPILSTSLKNNDDKVKEYFTDASLIHDDYKNDVDVVIDGGPGNLEPSAIIDCTGDELLLVREGIRDLK